MKNSATLIFIFIFHLPNFLFSQLPDSDIWLLDLKVENGKFTFSNPMNITNRTGYDNQPSFSPDGKSVYFVSIKDDNQSDVYHYDIEKKSLRQFCKTEESEYSPMVTPDKKFISVVRVEKDSTQRLWKFPIHGGEPVLIADKVDSVGYYCWGDNNTLAVFIVTEPATLWVFDTKNKHPIKIADNIGRSLQRIDKKNFLFFRKTPQGNEIKWCETDFKDTFGSTFFLPTIGEGEDFCIDKKKALMSSKSEIYVCDFNKKKWILAEDLSKFGIENINRIAVNRKGDKIAVVSNKK